MELLRELMRKAERNQMMTQTMSLHQLEHKHAPDPRQAEWNAQKAAGQWPGWKATGPPPKSVNPSSGRPPKMNYDPNDDQWATESAVPKADPPILQIFGNVQQGTPPINLPPAATATGKSGFPEHSAAAMGTESTFPPAKAAAPTAENSAARQLPIPKASGPNKAARNSTPKIEEVPEEEVGDGNGGRMDESFKRSRDVFEDEDELFALFCKADNALSCTPQTCCALLAMNAWLCTRNFAMRASCLRVSFAPASLRCSLRPRATRSHAGLC